MGNDTPMTFPLILIAGEISWTVICGCTWMRLTAEHFLHFTVKVAEPISPMSKVRPQRAQEILVELSFSLIRIVVSRDRYCYFFSTVPNFLDYFDEC